VAAHAAMEKEAKKERLEARFTPEQKKQIDHAARIKGTSVSDFVVLSADAAAVRTIREQEVLTPNERAREAFAHALLNPLHRAHDWSLPQNDTRNGPRSRWFPNRRNGATSNSNHLGRRMIERLSRVAVNPSIVTCKSRPVKMARNAWPSALY
jgi:uncharacterized protein (DUF1778 family)